VLSPDAELQELAKASFARRLTPAEDARIRALSFQPDAEMERARLIRDRHPDLYGLVLGQLRQRLEGVTSGQGRQEGYEPRRQAALDAGRTVPEADAQRIAEIDQLAAEYRATAADPHADLAERHRAAFQSAIRAGGLGPDAVLVWITWLADHEAANALAARRARVLQQFGHSTSADRRFAPSLIPELEAALGGRTIAETMPIIQR
jgi:hypothetical protein